MIYLIFVLFWDNKYDDDDDDDDADTVRKELILHSYIAKRKFHSFVSLFCHELVGAFRHVDLRLTLG